MIDRNITEDQLFDLFVQGKAEEFERALPRPDKSVVLIQGPLAKNKYTIEIEEYVKAHLRGEKVQILMDKGELIASHGNKRFSLTKAMKYANFNHIGFDDADKRNYVKFLKGASRTKPQNRDGGFPSEGDFNKRDKTNECRSLHYGEKLAINIYTTDYYRVCNPFMRGDYTKIKKLNKRALSEDVSEMLAHISMSVSGLNQLPDADLPSATFRVEDDVPDFVLKARMDAAAQGGGITTEMAFVSTSKGKPKGDRLSANSARIVYKNVRGKDVAALSAFSGNFEKEFLIPPTQMAWTRGVELPGRKFFFMAEPVTTLSHMPQEALEMSIDLMNGEIPDLNQQIPVPSQSSQPHVSLDPSQEQSPKPGLQTTTIPWFPNHQKPMLDMIHYVNNKWLSKPYEKDKKQVFITADGRRVFRPVHALAHTLRAMSLVVPIFEDLQKLDDSTLFQINNFGLREKYEGETVDSIKKLKDMPESELRKIQACLAFSVVGRIDEDMDSHEKQILGPKYFKEYFTTNGKFDGKGIFTDQEDMEKYAVFIRNYNTGYKLPVGLIMRIAHMSDLVRVLPTRPLVRGINGDNVALFGDKMLNLAGELCRATGDKDVFSGKTRKGEYTDDLFYECSTSPVVCLSKIGVQLNKSRQYELIHFQSQNIRPDPSKQGELALIKDESEAKARARAQERRVQEGMRFEAELAQRAHEIFLDKDEPIRGIHLAKKKTTIPAKEREPREATILPLVDLRPKDKNRFEAFFKSFGEGTNAIMGNLKKQYQGKQTEKGAKRLLQKIHLATTGKGISAKRNKQFMLLATIIDKLQKDPTLNTHEKGVIFYGALQVVIDNIHRTEKRNKFKSRLESMCHQLQRNLEYDIGINPNDRSLVKVLYHAYIPDKEKSAEKFREIANKSYEEMPRPKKR